MLLNFGGGEETEDEIQIECIHFCRRSPSLRRFKKNRERKCQFFVMYFLSHDGANIQKFILPDYDYDCNYFSTVRKVLN